jgi:hypothetical protein
LDVGETPAVLTLRRIKRLPLGISSSHRRSSSSWMVRASFSKCTRSLLAFAQGLQCCLSAAARLDLRSTLRWQCALAWILGEIFSEWLQVCGVKNPKGCGFYL